MESFVLSTQLFEDNLYNPLWKIYPCRSVSPLVCISSKFRLNSTKLDDAVILKADWLIWSAVTMIIFSDWSVC